MQELDSVRLLGFAVDDEENEQYVRCLAAPVFDHACKVIAALSVSGLIVHLPEDKIEEVAEVVKARANKISSKLGYHG